MNKDKWKIAGIISVAFALSFSSAISTILGGVGKTFQQATSSQIQGVYSAISLGAIPVILLGGILATTVRKKTITICALLMILIGGCAGFAGYQCLAILYFSSVFIGGGINLGQTMLFSIISEEYDGQAKAFWGGICGAAFSISGVFYSVSSGVLAEQNGWQYAYLLSLVTVVWCAICFFCLPARPVCNVVKADASPARFSISARYVFYVMLGSLFMLAYNAYNTNVASLILEKNLGGSYEASLAISFSVFAGIPSGILCGKLFKVSGNQFMSVSVSCLAAGLFITAVSTGMISLCAGSFLVGLGNGFRVPGNTVVISGMFDVRYNALGIGIYNAVGCVSGFIAPFVLNFLSASSASLAKNCLLWSAVFASIAFIGHVFDGFVLAPKKKEEKK